ncbi:hypothetical protein [Helicobacter turcicus]|uniref:Ferrochelatase n=1 Tax=Helicobacter turcicus TaxID=2867412 RepID=A0ABS7JMZ9_9HELI|nr:hypothetical protein [Helicobacter turcicus]MBX7490779.1 hypothetical protein [Helicobacter turcicus]MBX7545612.1 hypothetical protein [Helicobacter turcicus]
MKGIQIGVNEIVEIAFGTLLNKPSISFFCQICDQSSSIRKGDLFVVTNKDSSQAQKDIKEAVQKGAFGILFSGNIAMSDKEVAWISVEDLEQSLMRILRHYLLINNKILFLLSKDEYEIATQIITHKKTLEHFCGSLSGLIHNVIQSDAAFFLYCNTSLDLSTLPKNQQEIKALSQEKIDEDKLPFALNSYSLFGIKLFYKSTDYEIPLPKLFIQPLARVLRLCEDYSINVQLENFTALANFKPLYLDERGVIAKPGTTNKVLLACGDSKLYEQYLAYFSMYAKWAHLTLFVPKIYHELYAPYAKVIPYADKKTLFAALVNEKYNFALILGTNTHTLEAQFTHQITEANLFNYTKE